MSTIPTMATMDMPKWTDRLMKTFDNRIILTSSDKNQLKNQLIYLNYLNNTKNIIKSIVHMPTRIHTITVLKSPHVFKKAKDSYHCKLNKVIICLGDVDFTNKMVLQFISNVPKTITVKMVTKQRMVDPLKVHPPM